MANPTLSAIMWGFALLVSALAVVSFARGLAHMWRTIASGTPDPGRLRPVGRRLWGVLSAALTHGRPLNSRWVRAAETTPHARLPTGRRRPGSGVPAETVRHM